MVKPLPLTTRDLVKGHNKHYICSALKTNQKFSSHTGGVSFLRLVNRRLALAKLARLTQLPTAGRGSFEFVQGKYLTSVSS